MLCATTVTTIHYLGVLVCALDTRFPDYEDAVLHEAARAAGVAAIVTRNTKDFSGATVPVFAPEELLSATLAEKP